MLAEPYPQLIDSSLAKDQNRDGAKIRSAAGAGGLLPKHMQEQHGANVKSDPKRSSPGICPSSYGPAAGRPPHLLPPQSENNGGGGGGGGASREKTQNKQMSVQEQELRSLGKTTMTAASFVNAVVLHQISCETAQSEAGGAASANQGKTSWIAVTLLALVARCWWLALYRIRGGSKVSGGGRGGSICKYMFTCSNPS